MTFAPANKVQLNDPKNPPVELRVYLRIGEYVGQLDETRIFANEEHAHEYAGAAYGGNPGYICIITEFPVFFEGSHKELVTIKQDPAGEETF